MDLLRWFSRDPGDGQATRAHVQMASWRCRCYFHGGRGGVIRRSPASRQLNVLCLIGGVVGGVSSRGGVLSLRTVLWALRWRHVRPNQKRHICVLLVIWVSSFFVGLAGETPLRPVPRIKRQLVVFQCAYDQLCRPSPGGALFFLSLHFEYVCCILALT